MQDGMSLTVSVDVSLSLIFFNSIQLELWLVLFANYDVFLSQLTLRIVWNARRHTSISPTVIQVFTGRNRPGQEVGTWY